MLVENPRARRVVVYTWNFHPDLVEQRPPQGVHGYLSKTLPARDLVAALEAVHAGEIVVSEAPARARTRHGLDWPGRGEGLTDRESEILALITQGMSNAEVAALTYLSPNTVKSYIRTLYRKIGVAAAPRRCSGASSNGFTPTTTGSTTGAAAPDGSLLTFVGRLALCGPRRHGRAGEGDSMPVHIALLGEQVIADDATGAIRSRSSRHRALVGHLVANAGVPRRQQLAGLFWPDSTDAQALTNLRRELHHLRRLLGADAPWR